MLRCSRRTGLFFVSSALLVFASSGGSSEEGTPQAHTPPPAVTGTSSASSDMTVDTFLDRLMISESGGRDYAANPRSTALGPFQFIKATFLFVARRHLADTASLTDEQILALRTDRVFARRAAEAYTKENAAALKASGFEPTFVRLRLAYLVGPGGALKVLRAEPEEPLFKLLPAGVLRANPFMIGMSAAGLIAKSARDITSRPESVAKLDVPADVVSASRPDVPALKVRCERQLPSCKRWVALRTRKLVADQKRRTRLVKGQADGGA